MFSMKHNFDLVMNKVNLSSSVSFNVSFPNVQGSTNRVSAHPWRIATTASRVEEARVFRCSPSTRKAPAFKGAPLKKEPFGMPF